MRFGPSSVISRRKSTQRPAGWVLELLMRSVAKCIHRVRVYSNQSIDDRIYSFPYIPPMSLLHLVSLQLPRGEECSFTNHAREILWKCKNCELTFQYAFFILARNFFPTGRHRENILQRNIFPVCVWLLPNKALFPYVRVTWRSLQRDVVNITLP